MSPTRELEFRAKDSSFESLQSSAGISPEIWFLLRSRKLSSWKSPKDFGIWPVIFAPEMTRVLRNLSDWKFEGNSPWRFTELRLRLMTWEFGLQMTPYHLQGLESVGFHELSSSEENFRVFFHWRRARPWLSMERQERKKKRKGTAIDRRVADREEGIGGCGEGKRMKKETEICVGIVEGETPCFVYRRNIEIWICVVTN